MLSIDNKLSLSPVMVTYPLTFTILEWDKKNTNKQQQKTNILKKTCSRLQINAENSYKLELKKKIS